MCIRDRDKGVAEAVDADLKAVVENTPKVVESKMNDLRVADAITEIFALFKRCNKYIDETMPWALAKDEVAKDRLETVPVSYTHLLWNSYQCELHYRGYIYTDIYQVIT